jgi:hypothetical protein
LTAINFFAFCIETKITFTFKTHENSIDKIEAKTLSIMPLCKMALTDVGLLATIRIKTPLSIMLC